MAYDKTTWKTGDTITAEKLNKLEDAAAKELQWITVHDVTLSEQTNAILIDKDQNGRPITDYNPIAISYILETPADSTQESTSVSYWVYPQKEKYDASARLIISIAGAKTTARVNGHVFIGGNDVILVAGTTGGAMPGYKLDAIMDGIYLYINKTGDHFPVGTRVVVCVLGVAP